MKRRFISAFAVVALLLTMLSPVALAEGRILHIDSARDLRDLSEKCILDTYSQGLNVIMDKDIDLSQESFYPIPCFSGSFDGNGHSITGFTLASDGSHQGLFRYLMSGASISNLSVEGTVEPDNSRSQVGGIVGTSYGVISACSFNGKVTGLNYVGGIVGENYGTVEDCHAAGVISGKRFTGGIAGYSDGMISECSNTASVNTSITAGGLDLDSLSVSTLAGNSLTGAEDTDVVSDTGGIVGFTIGIVKDCENKGQIGYPHYGYNVGGIAGRQSGYIVSCTNYGDVCGRKDVAGIVGQMEPYLLLKRSASLADEVAILQAMISAAMSNLNGMSMEMEAALYSMSLNASNAVEDFYNNYVPGGSGGGGGETTDPPGGGETTDPPGGGETTDPPGGGETTDPPGGEETTDSSGETPAAATGIAARGVGPVSARLAELTKRVNPTRRNLSSLEPGDISQLEPGDISQTVQDILDSNKDNEALKDDLNQMGGDMNRFTDALGNASESLTGSLTGISAQFSKIMLMMVNAVSGTSKLDIYDDVSATEPEDSIQGKVTLCVNHGQIDGDTNVGGIAGDMGIEYEFDLENEIMSIFTSQDIISSSYESKCISRNNKNYGAIFAKKDNVGGVVGQAELGIVDKCEGYGDVSSTEGGYVGGIVGNSATSVTNSYAMCEMSGSEYVGGIAGYGVKILDCATIVGIKDATACCGAIAGWTDVSDKESISGNVYVSERLGAVDGISYSGIAEGVSYRTLMSNDTYPEEFGVLKLSFMADGVLVAEVPFEYGGSIDASAIPSVPRKDGFNGRWEDYDYTSLYYSDKIEAVYSINQTALAANVYRDESNQSIVLAEGDFSDKTRLKLNDYTGAGPDESLGKTVELWTLTVENGGGNKNYSIHYLEPEHSMKASRIKLYALSDGGWTELTTTTNGSYMLFNMNGESMTFCAVEAKAAPVWAYAVGGIAVAGVAAFLLIRAAKKKKTAVSAEKAEKAENSGSKPE